MPAHNTLVTSKTTLVTYRVMRMTKQPKISRSLRPIVDKNHDGTTTTKARVTRPTMRFTSLIFSDRD
jgi:hypothetical protein